MTELLPTVRTKARHFLSKRRLVLLASVAAVSATVILAGPGGFRPVTFGGTAAHAVCRLESSFAPAGGETG